MTKLVAIPPLNITQANAAHRFFTETNNTGEDLIISKPIIGVNKLSLDSTSSMITVTNLDLYHSKAFKIYDSLIDDSMCNLSSLLPLLVIDLYIYISLSK